MKEKKGFTLVELIAVIVLLSIVSILAVVSISSIRTKVAERSYVNLASRIEVAAENYSSDKGIKRVFVQTLIDAGLLDTDDETKLIHDPRDQSQSLNCHIVSIENGSAFLGDEDTDCSAKVLSDDALIIKYCPESNPNCTPMPLTEDWQKENVILYVFPSDPKLLSLEGAEYRWISPLAPDEVYTTKENSYVVSSGSVNDQYEVTVNVDGSDYTAYASVKIDKVSPRVYDFYDKNPENWASTKDLTFKLSDNESGLKKYGFSTEAGVMPSEWIEIENGKNNDTFNTSYNFSGFGTSAELYVWVEDIAGNSNNGEMATGGGLKINNIDAEGADRISISKNTEEIVREVVLTGTAQDDKSGLVGYNFSQGTTGITANDPGWNSFKKTNDEVKHNQTVTVKGDYSYCVKDAVNNSSCASIRVDNIDDRIDYVYVSNDTWGYTDRVTLTGYMQDYESGIVGYAFTTSSSRPSSFTSVSKTNDYLTYTYTATRNGTYYLWVKDAVGNVDKAEVYVNNIARKYTKQISLRAENDSYATGSLYASGLKEIINYYADNGYANAYVNGNYISVSASGGTTRYGTKYTTCYDSPSMYYASSYETCSYYGCPYGGVDMYGTCTGPRGSSYTLQGNYSQVSCNCIIYTGWVCNDPGTTTYCDSGYSRDFNSWYNCQPGDPTYGCAPGQTASFGRSCQSTCTWQNGTYAHQCMSYQTNYTCGYGAVQDGYYCYTCSSGSYNRYSGQCESSCSYGYSYWTYTVTVEYYAD